MKVRLKNITDNREYKILRKDKLCSCSFCPHHRGENAKHDDYRSWKKWRKTQYKKIRKFEGMIDMKTYYKVDLVRLPKNKGYQFKISEYFQIKENAQNIFLIASTNLTNNGDYAKYIKLEKEIFNKYYVNEDKINEIKELLVAREREILEKEYKNLKALMEKINNIPERIIR